MRDGTQLIGIDSRNAKYIKVEPITESGEPMGSITKVTAVSSDPTVVATNVTEYKTVSFSTKKKGNASITITATDEVNGYEAQKTIVFHVIEVADAVDVITGDVIDQEVMFDKGRSLEIENELLSSISFKINNTYKNILMLKRQEKSSDSHYADVEVTITDGVYTVTDVVGSGLPQAHFSLEGINDSPTIGAAAQIGIVSMIFQNE